MRTTCAGSCSGEKPALNEVIRGKRTGSREEKTGKTDEVERGQFVHRPGTGLTINEESDLEVDRQHQSGYAREGSDKDRQGAEKLSSYAQTERDRGSPSERIHPFAASGGQEQL